MTTAQTQKQIDYIIKQIKYNMNMMSWDYVPAEPYTRWRASSWYNSDVIPGKVYNVRITAMSAVIINIETGLFVDHVTEAEVRKYFTPEHKQFEDKMDGLLGE